MEKSYDPRLVKKRRMIRGSSYGSGPPKDRRMIPSRLQSVVSSLFGDFDLLIKLDSDYINLSSPHTFMVN